MKSTVNRGNEISKTRFLDVDVWQKTFGTVSEKAVIEIYAKEFKVKRKDIKSLDFSKCLFALRVKKDPTYRNNY